ncbi:MAG: DUF3536 domain-containing protein [Dehalogenimonas sp.]
MSERFICIHGHFYQPPRENPWLETVEIESSAAPFHDWNERITKECYAANLATRILDNQGQIVNIVNNYADLSFDFGPTLLSWLETNRPEVYASLINSGSKNKTSRSSPGTPIAQAFNHMIMPLADSRDKRTQVIWGIADFHHRFGSNPDGMWLPETAVDLETLEIIASKGIKYTILAPHQASRIKPPGGQWQDLPEGINTSRLYRCPLPSGNHINIAFFHPQLSRDIAFGDILKNGDILTSRVLESFQSTPDIPSLITIATDGETFGHHHRFGDMALAYTVDKLKQVGVRVTNIAKFLALYPPDHEVEIKENTAWSCDHGIERWRSGCCCTTGLHPDWNQYWRAPLRRAIELLRDRLNPLFEVEAGKLLSNPWAARDDYHRVMVDRSPSNIANFFGQWAIHPLSAAETSKALTLLELQRALMASSTSCGWFFDDIAGLESGLVLKQAGRAIELAKSVFGTTSENAFFDILQEASSNQKGLGTGRDIYLRKVRAAAVGLENIAAYFALNCIFEPTENNKNIFCFRVDKTDIKSFGVAPAIQIVGNVSITSISTGEHKRFVFTTILSGSLLQAGVKAFTTEIEYELLSNKAEKLSISNPEPAIIQNFLVSEFPENVYQPHDLSPDNQRVIIERLMTNSLAEAESSYQAIFDSSRSIIQLGASLGLPIPDKFTAAAAIVLNSRLMSQLKNTETCLPAFETTLKECSAWNVQLDISPLSDNLAMYLVAALGDEPDTAALNNIVNILDIFENSGVSPDLWELQNRVNALRQKESYPLLNNNSESAEWITAFNRLTIRLNLRIQ